MLPTRVLVVDGHELFRRGLLMLLSHEPDIEVVGECGDAGSAVELAESASPDLVLMDVRLPGAGDACRAVIRAAPAVRILMLATEEGEDGLVAAVAAGASGHLLKETSLDEVAAAIRTAVDGIAVLSPSSVSAGSIPPRRTTRAWPDAPLRAVRDDSASLS